MHKFVRGIFFRINFFLLILFVSGHAYSLPLVLPENFHPVAPGIFRSAQPDELMMNNLTSIGFKSVLNLRQWHDDTDETKNTYLELGRVPMDAANITDEKIIEALKFIKNANKPVLIHCWHGSDRTGVVVAMYRLVFEGVSKEEVIKELKIPEYGYHKIIYANIERYLDEVDVEQIKKAVFSD
ncbi:tyrosine-protein phosphatase [Thorsellia kenyensis]|uniref:Tyrosine-protein phosphatase n=1 Tax=Thorsellia kenyensis TaxID=1549888 RepID=A0ABV6CHI0_9GAMM